MAYEQDRPVGGWTSNVLPPPPPPRTQDVLPGGPSRRRGPRLLVLLASIVAFALVVATGLGLVFSASPGAPAAVSSAPIRTVPQSGTNGNRTDGGIDVRSIASRVAPAVVDINTTLTSFSMPGAAGRAAGTGIILTSSGEVLTNNHVIQNASTIRVTVDSGSTYTAEVLGVDPTHDVALLQLQGASDLPTATLADSSSLMIGEEVVAMGNALGRGGAPSVTAGTITGLDRSIIARSDIGGGEHLQNLIQTDASISPGDSGGPLVNADGQVVGMITAGANVHTSTSTNVAFAIPADDAISVVDQVRSGNEGPNVIIGEAGYLGIEVAPLDPGTAARLGLGSDANGVLVAGTLANGPAEQAGIATGSVITAVDGQKISSADQLGSALHQHAPGEQVQITWVDGSGSHTATVRLTSGPAV
jgi:S1-C subfamily serine protease